MLSRELIQSDEREATVWIDEPQVLVVASVSMSFNDRYRAALNSASGTFSPDVVSRFGDAGL